MKQHYLTCITSLIIGYLIILTTQYHPVYASRFFRNHTPLSQPTKEVINKRSYNQQVFDKGNGTYQAKIHTGHINYYNSDTNQFLPIDTSLTQTQNGWTMNQASYHLRLPRFADEPFDFINNYQDNGQETVTLTALGTRHLQGHIITDPQDPWANKAIRYPDAYGGQTDLLLRARNNGFDKLVVINQKPKDLSGDLEFAFNLQYGDYRFKNSQGVIIDSTGFPYETEKALIIENLKQTWFRDFRMWDSSTPSKSVSIKIRLEKVKDSYRLTKILDKSWLASATYPVYTDLTESYYSGAGDGAVYNEGNNWDNAHDATDGDGFNYTGTGMTTWTESNSGNTYAGIERIFIPINTADLPDNAVITAATLYFYPYGRSNGTNDGSDFITVVQTSQASNTALANADFDQAGAIDNPTEGIDTGGRLDITDITLNQYNSFTLNATGRGWISMSGYTKLGLRLGHDVLDTRNVAGNALTIYTSEQTGTGNDPYLYVEYNEIEPTPTPTPAPTAAPAIKTFTVALWVNPTTSIASKALAVKDGEIRLVTNADGKPLCQFHNGTSWQTAATASTTLSLSSWQHVACTYDRSQLSVYVNGALSGSQTLNNTLLVDTTNTWRFGSDAGGTYADLSGSLDETRIYNRALSPAEVQQLYTWAPGPLGYWKLDETTGTRYDSSGNNHLSVFGTVGSVTGKINSASNFLNSGSNMLHITDANQTNLNITGPITISGWIKPYSVASGASFTIAAKALEKDSSDTDLGYWCGLIQNGETMNPRFMVSENGSTWTSVSAPTAHAATLNTWNHISCIYTGTQLLIYRNGVLANSSSYSSGIYNNIGDFSIGGTDYTGGAQVLYRSDAAIDEVKIYNYARTPEQIIQDMNAGHPAPGSPIGSELIHLKFDEGYGDTAYDSGPLGKNGNLGDTNTCPGHITCPGWSNAGKFGKALAFDADVFNNTRVTTPLVTSLTDNFAFSSWVNWSGDNDKNQTFLQNGGDGDGWIFRTNNTTNNLEIVCSGKDTATTSTSLTQGKWQHLLIQKNNGAWQIYLDTKPVAVGGSGASCVPYTPTTRTVIGNTYSANNAFYGLMDEFTAYGFALTPEQINVLYNQGQATVFGATSTDSSGNPSWSATNEYCPPGQTSACVGPVAEWKLDEKTGQYAQDTSGNNHYGRLGATTGTDSSDPTWKSIGECKLGACLSFDSDDYIQVTRTATLEPVNPSVSMWVKSANPGTGDRYIFSKFRTEFDDDSYVFNSHPTNGIKYTVRVASGGCESPATGSSIWDNQWHQIVGVYNGTTNSIYVDGKLVGTTSCAVSGNVVYNSSDLYFGRREASLGPSFLGSIDNIRVYNYPRTQSQVSWEFNRGGPIGWWKMDENVSGNSKTLYDSSGFNNHGTTNWGANSSGMDCTVAGKRSTACDFDGTDDYVNISNDSGKLTLDNSITLSAWIKASNGNSGTVMYKGHSDGNYNNYAISLDSSKLAFGYRNAAETTWHTFSSNNTFTWTDGWHHIVFTYTFGGGNTAKFYIDGTHIPGSWTQGTGNDLPTTVYTAFNIGRRGTSIGDYFSGQIDEVKVFNYTMTPQQIKLDHAGAAIKFGP